MQLFLHSLANISCNLTLAKKGSNQDHCSVQVCFLAKITRLRRLYSHIFRAFESKLSSNFVNILIFFIFFSCMSQKAELPSLTGHRTKTRKRDEKQVNNPTGFRDSVIEGLSKTGQEGSDITEIEVSGSNNLS